MVDRSWPARASGECRVKPPPETRLHEHEVGDRHDHDTGQERCSQLLNSTFNHGLTTSLAGDTVTGLALILVGLRNGDRLLNGLRDIVSDLGRAHLRQPLRGG